MLTTVVLVFLADARDAIVERGLARIALRVNDPGVPTTRLDMFFYVRDVEIREV